MSPTILQFLTIVGRYTMFLGGYCWLSQHYDCMAYSLERKLKSCNTVPTDKKQKYTATHVLKYLQKSVTSSFSLIHYCFAFSLIQHCFIWIMVSCFLYFGSNIELWLWFHNSWSRFCFIKSIIKSFVSFQLLLRQILLFSYNFLMIRFSFMSKTLKKNVLITVKWRKYCQKQKYKTII